MNHQEKRIPGKQEFGFVSPQLGKAKELVHGELAIPPVSESVQHYIVTGELPEGLQISPEIKAKVDKLMQEIQALLSK